MRDFLRIAREMGVDMSWAFRDDPKKEQHKRDRSKRLKRKQARQARRKNR